MHAFLSSLTAATLVIHALLGCCRHAEHELACCDTSTACATHAPNECSHDDHCGAGNCDQSPTAPCRCRLECKSLCNYLPPEKMVLDARQLVPSVDFALVDAGWTSASIAAFQPFKGRLGEPGMLSSAPRLHLLHQILLI